jgi:hypothetical protein
MPFEVRTWPDIGTGRAPETSQWLVRCGWVLCSVEGSDGFEEPPQRLGCCHLTLAFVWAGIVWWQQRHTGG